MHRGYKLPGVCRFPDLLLKYPGPFPCGSIRIVFYLLLWVWAVDLLPVVVCVGLQFVACGGCAWFYTGFAFGSLGKVLFYGLLCRQILILRYCYIGKFIFAGVAWLFACPLVLSGKFEGFLCFGCWTVGRGCRLSSYIAAWVMGKILVNNLGSKTK